MKFLVTFVVGRLPKKSKASIIKSPFVPTGGDFPFSTDVDGGAA